ncbi:MAG: U32 family peptidase [Elusimicrobiales bacterium]|nr:U32 family peptidase [Elusimicrobiales bacterium]
MKIVASFSRLEEIKPLAAAGADELYCSVDPLFSFGDPVGLPSFRELGRAAAAAHALGLKLSLAVNHVNPVFKVSEEAGLVRKFSAARAAGVDAFIFANPGVLALLGRADLRGAQLHLSSVQPCFNSLTAGLFIGLGVSRVILPNQLAPLEAAALLKLCAARGVDTELFDYRFFGCAYVNGRCGLHRPDNYTLKVRVPPGSMCRPELGGAALPRAVNPRPAWLDRVPALSARVADRFGCGGGPRLANAASFFDYFVSGVQYLKYGTRPDRAAVKARKVAALRAMLDLAEELAAALPRAEARERFILKMEKWDGGSVRHAS